MRHDPYEPTFPCAPLTVSVPELIDGRDLPLASYNTGPEGNVSPAVVWSGLPAGTESLVVTAFDADSPIPGGLWHWVAKDIPAAQTGLAAGAGRVGGDRLPAGAAHWPNSLGALGYSGAKPPAGTGDHRLFIAVTALSVARLDLPPGASIALLHILMIPHTLARGVAVGWSHAPDTEGWARLGGAS